MCIYIYIYIYTHIIHYVYDYILYIMNYRSGLRGSRLLAVYTIAIRGGFLWNLLGRNTM